MNCREAKILFVSRLMGDFEPGSEIGRQLEVHLASCSSCAQEYAVCGQTLRFLETHRPEVTLAFARLGAERSVGCRYGVAGVGKPVRRAFRIVFARGSRRAGGLAAAAACIALSLLLWGTQGFRTSESWRAGARDGGKVPETVTAAPAALRLEWWEHGLIRPLVAGEMVEATTDPRELRINGRHRLILNQRGAIHVEPLGDGARGGCLVRLKAGEIFAEVAHDGHPFVVQTAQGTATITGTKFDLLATATESTLIVVEGTVRFASDQGAVDVTAGQSSQITAGRAPTRPAVCDGVAKTAWARHIVPPIWPWASGAASEGHVSESLPLPELFAASPLEWPSGDDYAAWTREQENWFARQFPGLFCLRDALAAEGVEVSYPRLLLDSGAVWRFAYPSASEQCLLSDQEAAIIQGAACYGRDREWLQGKGLLRKPNGTEAPGVFGLQAFAAWQKDLVVATEHREERLGRTLLASWHACLYLLHTRSLLGLAVEAGQYHSAGLSDEDLLPLLRQQVNAAYRGAQEAITLLGKEEHEGSCQSEECGRLIQELQRETEEMTYVEGKLVDALEQID